MTPCGDRMLNAVQQKKAIKHEALQKVGDLVRHRLPNEKPLENPETLPPQILQYFTYYSVIIVFFYCVCVSGSRDHDGF